MSIAFVNFMQDALPGGFDDGIKYAYGKFTGIPSASELVRANPLNDVGAALGAAKDATAVLRCWQASP